MGRSVTLVRLRTVALIPFQAASGPFGAEVFDGNATNRDRDLSPWDMNRRRSPRRHATPTSPRDRLPAVEEKTNAVINLTSPSYSFPANATDVRLVRGDVVCRFIFDDGDSPVASSLAVVATPASARFFLEHIKPVREHAAIAAALSTSAPVRWEDKPVETVTPPMHVTLLAVNSMIEFGIVYLAFGAPQPGSLKSTDAVQQVLALVGVSLGIANFATWVLALEAAVST